MGYDNVNLWYAKDKDGKIVTIDKVDKNEEDEYFCPLCESKLRIRQGKERAWHFAHIDKRQCSSESMYHFWCKNELLKKCDKFIIKSEEEKEYICKEILIEQTYEFNKKPYRPDLTVITESGETIFFEMEYTNPKKLEDYIDIWMGLGNIVVQVDVKTLINSKSDKLNIFKALWYQGKCFNIKKGEDSIYHETIGKYKEQNYNKNINNKRKSDIERLDWLWKDIKKYKMDEFDIEHISDLIQSIEDLNSREVVVNIIKKSNCNQIITDYIDYNKNKINKFLKETFQDLSMLNYTIENPRKIYDRLFEGMIVYFKIENECFFQNKIDYNLNLDINHIKKCFVKKLHIRKLRIEINKICEDLFNHLNNIPNIKVNKVPYLNYYIGNYEPFYRLYLNDFSNAKYGDFISLDENTKIDEVKEFLLKKSNYYQWFNKEELKFLDYISKKIKNEYKNENIKIYFNLEKYNYLSVNLYYLNKSINIFEISKINIENKHMFYTQIKNKIDLNYNDVINEIKIKKYNDEVNENINNFIEELNKRYKTVKRNWHFKRFNNEIVLWNDVHWNEGLSFKSKSIKNYENNKITIDEFKNKLLNEISDYIRNYIYGCDLK